MIQTSYRPGEWDFPTLYANGQWEPETHEVLKRFLTPGSLFIDVGAWVGPVTLWAADLGASVIAVEPDPEALKALRVNTADYPEVTIWPAALHHHAGTAPLAAHNYYGDSESRLVTLGEMPTFNPGEPPHFVTTVTPGQLFQRIPQIPALIKVDIEGTECGILPALTERCRAHRVPIYLSWHQPWWPQLVDDADRAAWFDGYQMEAIRGDGWTGFSEMLAIP